MTEIKTFDALVKGAFKFPKVEPSVCEGDSLRVVVSPSELYEERLHIYTEGQELYIVILILIYYYYEKVVKCVVVSIRKLPN
jgi:hypothetical protein